MVDAANEHLTVRAIKRLIDGALGSRGAWLLEPYADLPTSTGLNTYPIDQLAQTASIAVENGFQLCVHAIGDRANRETLNVYEAAFKANPDRKDLRWRVEHAQHIAATDIPRFGALGVIASMQGIHCTSDAPVRAGAARRRRAAEGALRLAEADEVGRRRSPTAPTRRSRRSTRMPGYHALVARRQKNGEVFYADQVMSREEALQGLHAQRRLRGVRGEDEGLADARQVRRHHGAFGRHHEGARGRDREGPGALHRGRREDRVREKELLILVDSC